MIQEIQDQFFRKMPESQQDFELFEYLPHVYFFVKDIKGRFVAANQMLVEKMGLGNKDNIIGKTDYELSPKYLAETYISDDRKIMETGNPMINHFELLFNYKKSVEWIVTTKLPVIGVRSQMIGVKGVTRDFQKMDKEIEGFREMQKAILYINSHYHEQIKMEDLANLYGVSVSSFARAFKKNFNTTPLKYINKVRVEMACQKLIDTNRSISEIAQGSGFFDQSHFSGIRSLPKSTIALLLPSIFLFWNETPCW